MSENEPPNPITFFSWSISFILILFLTFVIYINEGGNSLKSMLALNFNITIFLIFGLMMIILVIAVLKFFGFDVTKSGDNKEWNSGWGEK